MRYFFSTGEASGELAAVELARAIRVHDPQAQFEGIGANRMREAGFNVWRNNTGWASLGPFEAMQRLPKLVLAGMQTVRHIAKTQPDLMLVVDFGAFHVRMVKILREKFHYKGRILYWFPPSAWLDYERTAKTVASLSVPVPAFSHQYEFYQHLQLPAAYFGHPLASRYRMRAPRAAPAHDGGHIALLPGSRPSEIKRHAPVLERAAEILRQRRPKLVVTSDVPLRDAIGDADAAFVASGTAVLETVLSGVPAVALYILNPVLAKHARRVYSGKFITIPNLMMNKEIVPEILQEEATPENLANAMDDLLKNPQKQYGEFAAIRTMLGPSDALDRSAQFAIGLARGEISPSLGQSSP